MRIIQRLAKYLEYRKITAYSFERKTQVANGYLSKQLKGKGSIGSDILIRITKNYADLNLIWLITGEGQMLLDDADTLFTRGMTLQEDGRTYTKDDMVKTLHNHVAALERTIADKETIIKMLEDKLKEQARQVAVLETAAESA